MNVLEKILKEIKDLKEKQNSSNQDYATGYFSALSTVEGIISGVKENDGWIPVEEGFPEETGYYLAQLSRKLPNEDYSDRVVVLFNGEEKEFMCYAKLIIAWQPLPEQYRGDSNAQRQQRQTQAENKRERPL